MRVLCTICCATCTCRRTWPRRAPALQCLSVSLRRFSACLLQGVAEQDIFAISAATGAGVKELVRAVRAALDALPAELPAELAGGAESGDAPALNLTQAPGRQLSEDRLDQFGIEADLGGPRTWFVKVCVCRFSIRSI